MFESDDEDEEWNKPVDSSLCESPHSLPITQLKNSETTSRKDGPDHSRVILHIDIDCFYAQVEMIRNPSLRNKPLGIQQKYIVVTCNYPARERGVTKLMRIVDAKEKCPDLILVSGEDLTNYREMSYKISNYLQKYCPLVERLGFDENFLDITDLVKDRLDNDNNYGKEIKGHAFNEADIQDLCGCGCHDRLKVGSQVAADIREGLHDELGITCCGGVAVNKLLSKLVAGKHKPNCQTTLFPEQTGSLLRELTSIRQIPGIGSTTSKRLKELGINTVQELQNASKIALEEEFGTQTAENMKNWCYGIDKSPVIAFGLPQTLSDEDSFAARKVSNIAGVKLKLKELIGSLLQRLLSDGRIPRTFRLTVRKMSSDKKYLNRESKQCPLSASLFQKFNRENLASVCRQLENHAYDLFTKMVDVKQPFYLTLMNVAFTKLEQATSKNSITSFFSPKKSETKTSVGEQDKQVYKYNHDTEREKEFTNMQTYICKKGNISPGIISNVNTTTSKNNNEIMANGNSKDTVRRKSGLFNWLQKSGDTNDNTEKDEISVQRADTEDGLVSQNKRKAEDTLQSETCKISKPCDTHRLMKTKTEDQSNLLKDIDESVFKELPPDIQNEILSQSKMVQDNIKASSKANCVISDHTTSTGKNINNSPFFSSRKGKGLYKPDAATTSSSIPTEIASKCSDISSAHDKNSVSDNSTRNFQRQDIPQGVDRAVFEALPPEIQNELIENMKCGKKSNLSIKHNSTLSVKSPQSSSNVNIMSLFPKANKKK